MKLSASCGILFNRMFVLSFSSINLIRYLLTPVLLWKGGVRIRFSLLSKYTLLVVPKLRLSALPVSSDSRVCDRHHFLVRPMNVLTY